MKRKNFSLVWGRKLFFGIGWPLLLLISLAFAMLGTLPESVLSLSLMGLQIISQTGLIMMLGYFILFSPVVYVIPTYYFSRIWGISILNVLIGAYFLDAYSFVTYGLHLNPFIIGHLLLQVEALEWKAYLGIIPFLVMTVFLWMRGNRIWVIMQRKFMNTNSPWYIWLIVVSFLGVQLVNIYNQIHPSGYVQTVLNQFPVRIPLPEFKALSELKYKEHLPQDRSLTLYKKKNFYPKALSCHADKNFIFIVYQRAPEFIKHFNEHGIELTNHLAAKDSPQNALDSLIYSFPNALKSSQIGESQIVRVLRDYEYHVDFFSTNEDMRIDGVDSPKKIVEAKRWVKAYSESSSTNHFALFIYIDKNRTYEKTINDILIGLDKNKALDNTFIVVTALEGNPYKNDLVKVPFTLLGEGIIPRKVEEMTTSYDVVATLLQDSMACKGDTKEFSFGKNFLESSKDNYFVYTKNERPYLWIDDQEVNFSLKELNYFSKEINTSQVLELRNFYYNFFK